MSQTPAAHRSSTFSRRKMLAAGAAVAGLTGAAAASRADGAPRDDVALDTFRISKGRIRQSVMGWCFKPMPVPELLKHCQYIGLPAVEGISAEFYPLAKSLGLEIALVSSHGFAQGPVDPANHEMCEQKLRKSIDLAVKFGSRSVITFTGMRVTGMPDRVATKNCVDLWKRVIGYAEEQNVQLCLEHLNSRDASHPMKGHPGYYGDDVDFCVDLIRQVDSPAMKLLFDCYHVQVMNGDVIRRLKQYSEYIGHYHTAGNPGRGELDETQEMNYPPIMKAIVETGYEGYVAQEFIPTWDNPVRALRHAAKVCDV